MAHSSSSAPEPHPSTGPRALASPAPSANGDGRGQHAPALTESAGALAESARALTVSALLLMQLEDGGHQAAASLTPASGGHPGPPPSSGQPRPPEAPTPPPPPSPANTVVISDWPDRRPVPQDRSTTAPHSLSRPSDCSCFDLCDCPSLCVCSCACSSHAPARHPASPGCTVPARPSVHKCLARSIAPPCPTAAAPRPVPPLRRPPSNHARRGQVPPGSITAIYCVV